MGQEAKLESNGWRVILHDAIDDAITAGVTKQYILNEVDYAYDFLAEGYEVQEEVILA